VKSSSRSIFQEGLSIIRDSYETKGFSKPVIETMLRAQRDSTLKLYSSYLVKWKDYCVAHHFNYLNPTIQQATEFLQQLFEENDRKYSAINTARSALSLIIIWDKVRFGEHPDIVKFMQGVGKVKPTIPRYIDTWDPNVVLQLLLSWAPAKRLSLELLTLKTVMLLLLVSGKRPQIIRTLTIDHMKIRSGYYEIRFKPQDLKEGRLNYKPEILKLKKYPVNKKLCIHHYLSVYLERTLDIRGTERSLFLTLSKPHSQPSASTVSRWVKKVLKQAGVSEEYTAGSTRSAVASKAERGGGASRPDYESCWLDERVNIYKIL
jgi:integrase